MDEINFCPYCNASDHKIIGVKDTLLFCKECDRFFKFEEKKLKCIKCNSTKLVNSEFPAPDGQFIFQCKDCKKMFSTKELIEHNKLK